MKNACAQKLHGVTAPVADPVFLYVEGARIACLVREGKAPGIFWLGGFKSAMDGNKANALDDWAVRRGRAFARFDYFGHGRSGGDFRKGTITRWRDDALAVLDRLAVGPQILVGSSMGAWLALLVGAMRADRVAGLVLIAPAVDFTQALLEARLDDRARRAIAESGEWLRPSVYDPEPYPITRALLEDGRKYTLLGRGPLVMPAPVRILHGMNDPDVPWQHGLATFEAMQGNVRLTLVRDGDHRLSRPDDLRLLERTLDDLCEEVGC